ncbi:MULTISPECIES: dihydropteroate synthase [unclassified Pseudactinotalea]|uniref:dihydropteroate synthase n=1 Tax=unclassified Pseudactinotalea TaxID=2649176 RepID=UPI003C7E47B0
MSTRTQVMGIVNVTPDSFSDGGQWFERDVAIAHGRHLLAQGADILDIGGESTRPGASRVGVQEELDRVLPVIEGLLGHAPVLSVDTMRAQVASVAVQAGAGIINDVSGGRADPDMAAVAAESDARFILSHWRGHSDVMASLTKYDDVVEDVRAELSAQVQAVVDAGVSEERIIIDPGLGFAKDAEANWILLANLHRLQDLGFPVLVGASRKRFIGELLARHGAESLPTFRDRASAAISALVARSGAWAVRVHDVPISVDAVRVAQEFRTATRGLDQQALALTPDVAQG